jgi:hypothetical protein
MYGGSPFALDKRVLACTRCMTPVEAPATGGSARCARCGTQNDIGPRDESRDRAAAEAPAAISEAMRFERLRQQDGHPLPYPPAVHGLLAQGVDDQNASQVWSEWQQAKSELAAGGGYPAAERLYFLAMGLYGYLAPRRSDLELRALAETSLEHLTEPRHRQEMLARLTRAAANAGDLDSAQAWLALLAPHSDDIHMDTAYRFSAAWVATLAHDYQGALALLGARMDDVPIADSSDEICAVLRANAYDRLGQTQAAVDQLVQLMTRSPAGSKAVESILSHNQQHGFCPHSFELARQEVAQMQTSAVRTKGGFKFGCLFVPIFVGGFALAGVMGLVDEYVDDSYSGVVGAALVIGFIVMTFVVLAVALGKGAALRKRLQQTGVAGTAQIVGLRETGMRVNDQPQIEMQLMVSIPGRATYTAIHREVVSHLALARLQPGASLPVRVDPNDVAMMAIDW